MGNMRDHIICHKHSEPCKEKTQQKCKWSTEITNKVDWNSHGKSVRQANNQQYITTVKRNFRWQVVNKQQQKFFPNDTTTDKYPICKTAIET